MNSTHKRQLVIATGNASKGREMMEILSDLGIRIRTLADFPQVSDDVEETGETFAENAALKARAAAEATGEICIADDGGLVIDALGGQPGLHSKRFLGEGTPFKVKMERILDLMAEVPDSQRTCRFRCAVAVAIPGGKMYHAEGTCEGLVAREQRGEFGFGYDPIVLLPERGLHMAELSPAEKHVISHRGRALAAIRPVLEGLLIGGELGDG